MVLTAPAWFRHAAVARARVVKQARCVRGSCLIASYLYLVANANAAIVSRGEKDRTNSCSDLPRPTIHLLLICSAALGTCAWWPCGSLSHLATLLKSQLHFVGRGSDPYNSRNWFASKLPIRLLFCSIYVRKYVCGLGRGNLHESLMSTAAVKNLSRRRSSRQQKKLHTEDESARHPPISREQEPSP